MCLDNLGFALTKQGHLEAALDHHRRALAIRLRLLGPDHREVAISRTNLATALLKHGDRDAAESEFRASIAVWDHTVPDSPDVAYPLIGLGSVLRQRRAPAEAIEPLGRAVAVREAAGVDPVMLADAQLVLGETLVEAGIDRPRAIALLDAARVVFRSEDPATAAISNPAPAAVRGAWPPVFDVSAGILVVEVNLGNLQVHEIAGFHEAVDMGKIGRTGEAVFCQKIEQAPVVGGAAEVPGPDATG